MILRRIWNGFWFGPISPGALGLFRLVFGALVVWYGLLLWPDRWVWFSERGVLGKEDAARILEFLNPGPRLNPFDWGLNDRSLTLFFVVFLLAAVGLTLGLATRFCALLVFVGLNALHNRNVVILNSGDTVMMVMSAYLLLSPAGAACSLDRLRRIGHGREGDIPPPIIPWAQRLMQLQVSIVYLSTFCSKISGRLWQDGTAAFYPLHLPESARFPVPLTDGSHLWAIHLATYGTLAVELAMAAFVWVPRLRLFVLAAGTLLHLGIEYSLNIPLFSFLMIASYIPFLTEADLQRFLTRFRPVRRALRLVYDGECDFCRSALLIVRFLDVFGLVMFLDAHKPDELAQAEGVTFDEAERAAIAVDARGRKWAGFDAFRVLAWRLPAAWPLAPLLYLPGMAWAGRRVYAWVVVNRGRLPVAERFRRP